MACLNFELPQKNICIVGDGPLDVSSYIVGIC